MPFYEYQCENCCYQFEIKQSFNDDKTVICPRCQGLTRRIISPALVFYKRSGFYTTDNRHK